MKKFIGFVLLIAVLVAGYFVLKNYKPSQENNNQTTESQKIEIKDIKIEDNTKPFKINIAYPEITGLDDFNQKAKNIIDKELNDFKTNSLANDEAVKKIDPESYAKYPREYSLDISYKKGQTDENIISVIFTVYNFEGGAHGATYFIPLNYDSKLKKEIVLADLFENQPDYLQKISEFCVDDLKKQLTAVLGSDYTDLNWLNEGAGPKEENFTNFLINKENLVFYFQQYQVAPYSAGDFNVIYPK